MQEHRSASRDKLPLNLVKTSATLPDGSQLYGEAHNLSGGGALIQGQTGGLNVGDELVLISNLVGQPETKSRCVVKHIEPGRSYGVEFI